MASQQQQQHPQQQQAPQPATHNLAAPPEGIFRTFDDLLTNVQRSAKDNGYGVVKLRASNYREGKPTRYDLVCDRGGVKYNSTAKKRNPSTRKVDCPFRAKAVCEVQLGNQWRFQVQEARHNHEARTPTAPPAQEPSAVPANSMRTVTNRLDRISHEITNGFTRLENRLDRMEKRLDHLEKTHQGPAPVPMMAGMGGGMGPGMGGGMGGHMGPGLGGNPVVDGRMANLEGRMHAMENAMGGGRAVNGMNMPMGDVDDGLLTQDVSVLQ